MSPDLYDAGESFPIKPFFSWKTCKEIGKDDLALEGAHSTLQSWAEEPQETAVLGTDPGLLAWPGLLASPGLTVTV